VILNNLEFDHADIYPDLDAIKRQFHHLVRTVPGSGRIICNAADPNLADVLKQGCWTPCEGFAREGGTGVNWSAQVEPGSDYGRFELLLDGKSQGTVHWSQLGGHNVDNALAAIAAARHAGVPVAQGIEALSAFKGVRRRMELAGTAAGVHVYDDFAHHPTAIATTIDGLRRRIGKARLVAVLEPRSNTMKLGVHRDTLAPSLAGADEVFVFAPADLGWDASQITRPLGARAHLVAAMDDLVEQLAATLRAGDHVLVMSNGGFGGLHRRLLAVLKDRP
jgi:UDP-N-acetylmuramate: L-alanyl-gamma-D-glutamyl-meso-diaminopimelate ligase